MGDDALMRFAERINEICEDKNLPARGRQTRLGKEFNLTPNAARKWLLGEGMPELPMAVRIANWAGVNVQWLLQGTLPKSQAPTTVAAALILEEALRELPPEVARDLLDYIAYKITKAFEASPAKAARYARAIDSLAAGTFATKQPPRRAA